MGGSWSWSWLLTPVSPLPGVVPSTALSAIVIGHVWNSLPAIGLTNEENEGVVDSEKYRGGGVSRRQLRKWNHSCLLDRVVAVASRRAASSVKALVCCWVDQG